MCARVCYAIFLGSKNATLHSKIEHTANHFTVIQTLRVSKSTFSLIPNTLKVHIHLSMTHRVSRMKNQEIKKFSTTYPSPNVQRLHLWALKEDFLNLGNKQLILKMVFKNCEWHNFWPEHEFLWLIITFDGVEEFFLTKKCLLFHASQNEWKWR